MWVITVTPATREELSVSLAPAADCEAAGAVCTSDGRALSVGAAHIVSGPGPDTQTPEEPALTASFERLPQSHDGASAFRFRVVFSEEIGIGFRSMRDDSFTASGGEVVRLSSCGADYSRGPLIVGLSVGRTLAWAATAARAPGRSPRR